MATNIKPIPYGVSDFESVRLEDYYYVDKTGYIPSLENTRYTLFLRPRRFGKSLFANMLKAYYDINYADKFDALFGDLEIGKEPTPLHNTYLILSFNFSSVNSSPDKVQESFNEITLDQIRKFINRYEDRLPQNARQFVLESGLDCSMALSRANEIAGEAGYKIYVVIDEYDNFANTLMSVDESSYQQILHADGFVRLFYNVLKEATTDINKMDKLWTRWARRGEWKPFVEYVLSVMHDNDSVRDHNDEGEAFVKGFLLAHICHGNGYIVRTEAELDHGYSDIYMYPISGYRHALVIELKYLHRDATSAAVKSKAEEARKQIRGYISDKRLQAEADAKGWTLHAAIAVVKGWDAEVIEEVNS